MDKCFLGVDLAYYWLHREGHEINCFWGIILIK